VTVLVSGATGTTGSEVVRQLRAADIPVRVMTRRAESAERLSGQGVETFVADLADPSSLAAALEGVDAVYVATSASPQLPEHEGNLARAAVEAGVAHLVKLSVIGCSPESPLEFGRLHSASEAEVKATGIGWTMVRPNGFMQNTLAWARQIATGTVHLPVVDARWSIVDVRDVASVAVAALLDPHTHAGAAYTATGPQASSPREQVAILSELLGRPVAVQEVTIQQAMESLVGAGLSEWSARRMGELFALYADGLAEAVSEDIERVTGRPAHAYRDFAADSREAFAAALTMATTSKEIPA
jgi:uncharacterized protein YbjT (DUF2867 family)